MILGHINNLAAEIQAIATRIRVLFSTPPFNALHFDTLCTMHVDIYTLIGNRYSISFSLKKKNCCLLGYHFCVCHHISCFSFCFALILILNGITPHRQYRSLFHFYSSPILEIHLHFIAHCFSFVIWILSNWSVFWSNTKKKNIMRARLMQPIVFAIKQTPIFLFLPFLPPKNTFFDR